jgi:glycosyltransferase involved in cell wall biosynthesis
MLDMVGLSSVIRTANAVANGRFETWEGPLRVHPNGRRTQVAPDWTLAVSGAAADVSCGLVQAGEGFGLELQAAGVARWVRLEATLDLATLSSGRATRCALTYRMSGRRRDLEGAVRVLLVRRRHEIHEGGSFQDTTLVVLSEALPLAVDWTEIHWPLDPDAAARLAVEAARDRRASQAQHLLIVESSADFTLGVAEVALVVETDRGQPPDSTSFEDANVMAQAAYVCAGLTPPEPPPPVTPGLLDVRSICFVLPGRGGNGGANSILQEASELARLGLDVSVAVEKRRIESIRATYRDLLTEHPPSLNAFEASEDLAMLLKGRDVVCATSNGSVQMIASALDRLGAKAPRPFYYVQDYEPLFYPVGSQAWMEAVESYRALAGATLFAKSDWLRAVVHANHQLRVHKVEPSIDHALFHPRLRDRPEQATITAMLRPATPRRAPRRTARVLRALAERFPGRVRLEVFGASEPELAAADIRLPEEAAVHGGLTRPQVAALLQRTDLFLDLSDYQAFGRSGLEAMACGAVPVVPALGGAAEYAVDGVNAFCLDTRDEGRVLQAVTDFLQADEARRRSLSASARDTASAFSVRRAVTSELNLFTSPPSAR